MAGTRARGRHRTGGALIGLVFNSLTFLLFFIAVFALHRLIPGAAGKKWLRQYEKRGGCTAWLEHPAQASEEFLDGWLREQLRLYADGADPLSSLRRRGIGRP